MEQEKLPKYFYDMPMQCRYIDSDLSYHRGIVFHEWVVNLCTGRPVHIDNVFNYGRLLKLDDDDIIIEHMWKSI